MKVFGIGLNKTGTKTLGACFSMLGYRNATFNMDLLNEYSQGNIAAIMDYCKGYDSFEDWPWPLLYKQIDKRYPDAKFILTIRSSPEVWYNSLVKHARKTGPTLARKIVYGFENPFDHKNEHIAIYLKHNKDVIKYFDSRPGKLLGVCWENGDEWDKLSAFLGFGIPKMAFPHLNKSK